MSDKNILSFLNAKAKAAGIEVGLVEVIEQINQRFNLNIDMNDARLERLKSLYSVLNEAAVQRHTFELEKASPEVQKVFEKGIEVGKAQLLMDLIVCILEQDGLIERKQ